MSSGKLKYPADSILACPCGKEGPKAQMVSHRARTSNPLCRTVDKLLVVTPSTPNPWSERARAAELDDTSSMGSAGTAAAAGYVVGDEPAAEAEAAAVAAGKRAPRSGDAYVTPPPQAVPGSDGELVQQVGGRIPRTIDLWPSTVELIEITRTNPEFGWDGDVSTLINVAFHEFLKLLGYRLALVKEPPHAPMVMVPREVAVAAGLAAA